MKPNSLALLAGGLLSLTASSHSAVTSSNLLAYFDFEGTSNDQSGNGVNATLQGPAVISAIGTGYDSVGQSLDLGTIGNGAAATVTAGPHFDSAFTNNAMSVSFWQFNTAFGNSSAFWVHSVAAGANDRGFQAHTPWSNGTIFFDQSGCCAGPQRLTTTGALTDQWQHFVFQRDAAGNREIWVDGVLSNSAGGAEDLDAFNGLLTIGADNSLNNSFSGQIDEFAIWNTTLDPDDIAALAGGAATPSIIIPEPSGSVLAFLGAALLAGRRRRK